MQETFGPGVAVSPHIAAFPLLATVVNQNLAGQNVLGMFISDENKGIVRDVETSIRALRITAGPLRLSQIIEKGFFVDSPKSRILQLRDMCVLHARKREEIAAGMSAKPFDAGGIDLIAPLHFRGDERFPDVIAWLREERRQAEARGK